MFKNVCSKVKAPFHRGAERRAERKQYNQEAGRRLLEGDLSMVLRNTTPVQLPEFSAFSGYTEFDTSWSEADGDAKTNPVPSLGEGYVEETHERLLDSVVYTEGFKLDEVIKLIIDKKVELSPEMTWDEFKSFTKDMTIEELEGLVPEIVELARGISSHTREVAEGMFDMSSEVAHDMVMVALKRALGDDITENELFDVKGVIDLFLGSLYKEPPFTVEGFEEFLSHLTAGHVREIDIDGKLIHWIDNPIDVAGLERKR